jgi:hypothetical protein
MRLLGGVCAETRTVRVSRRCDDNHPGNKLRQTKMRLSATTGRRTQVHGNHNCNTTHRSIPRLQRGVVSARSRQRVRRRSGARTIIGGEPRRGQWARSTTASRRSESAIAPGGIGIASPDRPTRSGLRRSGPAELPDRVLRAPEVAIAPAQAICGRPWSSSRRPAEDSETGHLRHRLAKIYRRGCRHGRVVWVVFLS